MGAKVKFAAGVAGLLLIGGPLWPVALICFGYLALTFGLRGSAKKDSGRTSGEALRRVSALLLFALSAAAFASGGTLSPMMFFLGGVVALFWPRLTSFFRAEEVVPVENSILFRSKYLPFIWHALGELKAGSDSFPRALSSFSGTLFLFTDTGRAYALVTCCALGSRVAEAELSGQLRSWALRTRTGAFPFPLDSQAACEVFRYEYARVTRPSEDLVTAAASLSGVLVLGCSESSVREAGAYEIGGRRRSAKLPGQRRALGSPPLLWEVLESVGQKTRWPDPDSCSSLLDSLNVTRGVPLGERVKSIEGSGNGVSLKSLGGVEVQITRPQLRALVSMYS